MVGLLYFSATDHLSRRIIRVVTTAQATSLVLLFPGDHDTTNSLAVFRVTFFKPRVCFKQITWYIEMHHVRTFIYSVCCHDFFVLRDVYSQQCLSYYSAVTISKELTKNYEQTFFYSRGLCY